MEKDTLKVQISGLEREVDTSKKQLESKQKQIDDLLRDRDQTEKLYRKTKTEVDKKAELIKLQVILLVRYINSILVVVVVALLVSFSV